MNQSAIVALFQVFQQVDMKYHPLLKNMIASKVFVGPLASFEPYAEEADAVMSFLEQAGPVLIQFPTLLAAAQTAKA